MDLYLREILDLLTECEGAADQGFKEIDEKFINMPATQIYYPGIFGTAYGKLKFISPKILRARELLLKLDSAVEARS